MSAGTPTLLARLSLNQQTVRQWSLPELADGCARAGVRGVGLWRAPVRDYGVAAAARLVRDAGLSVTSLCRGGFFTALEPGERAAALDDNRAAIDEAAALGTDTLVLVSGGLPDGNRDLRGARERIADALAELGPYAAERGVRLAIEPLHPMYAADRCVVSTLAQALDLAERFPVEQVGVVVDTYHLWWDDTIGAQIARAGGMGGAAGEWGQGGVLSVRGGGRVTGEWGQGGVLSVRGGGRVTGEWGQGGVLSVRGGGRVTGGRIAAFQLADWITPLPEGVLLGRGQLGDGSVDLRWFRERVDATGYRGPVEVEIFNPGLWARDGAEVLAEVVDRFTAHVV
ncbi:sugar phosphate isomerase/epimerase family protein [Streptomyces halobius]|uniref:Sugar phosphate isomerase/epimerase n=1 Tax=Streptomyces halobius TaxID=2879846 RepID=A0ABY4MC18_9ACTN|nr:sugar phosphate isomerase/epimerase family protein [Streptomyces halobius]UQA95331.1 sugar phosphate isomerase/epimerase [Streptomyces halobius]